ncbi:MAG: hypothetical protein M3R02_20495 [Chloroflexota bacterium]|nr:hypothetical protein [Chloroflexota bacterium]
MGGCGSGRRADASPTTDTALVLDVRILARNGGLAPGFHAHTWPSVWGDVVVSYAAGEAELMFQYRTRPSWWSEWRDVRQAIRIERTSCHFGGSRPRFACPLCFHRVAVLYLFDGALRCRACHGLAYASTREDRPQRVLRKANRLRTKLGGEPALGIIPRRPDWLGERAYWKAIQRIRDLDEEFAAGVVGKYSSLEDLRRQTCGDDK